MKYSNPDEQLSQGFDALRNEETPTETTERAVRAVSNPVPARQLPKVAFRLVGATGTAAVLALAFWPREGSGIAWSQVVNQMTKAKRFHETLSLPKANGEWSNVIEHWSDGNRFAMSYGVAGKYVMMARFDGKRVYSEQGPFGYATIQTIPEKDRQREASLGFLGHGVQLIEDYIKDEKGKVEGQEKVTDPELGEVIRYKIRTSMLRNMKWVYTHRFIYVEPDTTRIRRWELLDQVGEVSERGSIEYPEKIDDSVFTIPEHPTMPVHDIDLERKEVAATIRKGIAEVHAGGAKAKVRVVLSEMNHYLWVFWSGAPPNGDLKYPVMVVGQKPTRAFGQPVFTSSRVTLTGPYPSLLGPEPLSGMCIPLFTKTPDTITLKIPLFVKDLKQPIRGASNKVLGYRSRFVGYDTLPNVHPIQVPSIYTFADYVGFHTNVPFKNRPVFIATGVAIGGLKKK